MPQDNLKRTAVCAAILNASRALQEIDAIYSTAGAHSADFPTSTEKTSIRNAANQALNHIEAALLVLGGLTQLLELEERQQ
jgi:hypothetical protein